MISACVPLIGHFSTSSQLTIPACVTRWLFKPSGDVGKGNPLKHVHVTAISNTDILPLYLTSFGGHHPELHKL